MNKIIHKSLRATTFAAVLVFLLYTGPAGNAGRVEAQEEGQWKTDFEMVFTPQYLCVGKPEHLNFFIDYIWEGPYNPNQPPLIPLMKGTVDAMASNGRLSKDHWEFSPMSEKYDLKGYKGFTYTPLAEGDENLEFHIQAPDNPKPVTVSFKVLHCEYHVTFKSKWTTTFTAPGGHILESEIPFSGEGDFDVVPFPNGSQDLLAYGVGKYKIDKLTIKGHGGGLGSCESSVKPFGIEEGSVRIIGNADKAGNIDVSILTIPIMLTAWVDTCQTPIGTIEKPMPSRLQNTQTKNLMNLHFPPEGGSLTIKGPPLDAPPLDANISELGHVEVKKK